VSDPKALGGANDSDLRRSESGLVVAEEEEARRPDERRLEQGLVAKVGLKPDDVPEPTGLAPVSEHAAGGGGRVGQQAYELGPNRARTARHGDEHIARGVDVRRLTCRGASS
jgi:hypothetical protein